MFRPGRFALSLALIPLFQMSPASVQAQYYRSPVVQHVRFNQPTTSPSDVPVPETPVPDPNAPNNAPDPTTPAPDAPVSEELIVDEIRFHESEVVEPDACPDCCCDDCCCNAPWRLFPERCGLSLTGWIAAGGTYNAKSPSSRFNGPVSFNDRNEYQANQVYAVLEKSAESDCCCWGIGGRVDVLFGTDYIFTQAAGLETHQDGSTKWNAGPQYGLALPQAYVEIAKGNLSAKVGHFYTIIGNEVVTAPDNFFYSHAYTMQYGEPFTHTGVLVTYDHSDQLQLLGGYVNGWDRFDGVTDRGAILAGFNWTDCCEQSSLAFAIIHDQEDVGALQTGRTMYSAVLSHAVNDCLDYVIQHDNGWQEDVAQWYGINQYLLYTINDCYKAGARFEWFRDDDGTRVSGVRTGNPNAGPFVGDFYEVSVGLNHTPHANVTFRPEVRYDWFEGMGQPFDDGTSSNQFLVAIDMIVLW